ncbi:MAG: hypothetical protein U9R34_04610 [Nanoarchaeota archaeon]|nr:hypothetical protein [Nanoarchaeota archaeon]
MILLLLGILFVLAAIVSLRCWQNNFPLKATSLACAMWVGLAFFRPRALVFIALLAIGYIYQKITQNNKTKKVEEVEEEIIFKNN